MTFKLLEGMARISVRLMKMVMPLVKELSPTHKALHTKEYFLKIEFMDTVRNHFII